MSEEDNWQEEVICFKCGKVLGYSSSPPWEDLCDECDEEVFFID